MKINIYTLQKIIMMSIVIIISGVSYSNADSLFFIHVGPPENYSPLGPHVPSIYKFNSESNSLEKIWSLNAPNWVSNVRVYSDRNEVIIGYNDKMESFLPSKLLHIYCDSTINNNNIISVSDDNFIADYKYYYSSNSSIISTYIRNINDETEEQKYYSLQTFNSLSTKSFSTKSLSDYSINLSGVKSLFYGTKSDVMTLRINDDNLFQDVRTGYIYNTIALNDSIIKLKDTPGYVCFVNNQDYCAIMSIPYENSKGTREILIYNYKNNIWNSFLIEGDGTKLRNINGCLIGNVIYSSPNADWVKRTNISPKATNRIVLLNPISLDLFYIDFDKLYEVLWFDYESYIYYKFENDMYRANVKNGVITGEELLISTPFIHGIHWAFKGSLGSN